ncbi:MAG: hypothetical protein FJZ07_02120, partial [Candidatus Nealsonbacteria bacterium]|nr:hypothetical protein [Candidatus Nealsonbacteria bacterium]
MINYFKKILKFGAVILVLIIFAQLLFFLNPQNEARSQTGFSFFKARIALAQFFFPRYPGRIKYIIGELNQASDQMVYYNSELRRLTNNCDCQNAQSQCGQETRGCTITAPRVFGEACPDRKEMQKIQIEIQNKNDQISFLRELLQKEMESGLKEELETLREEEAIQLESALNEILVSSQNVIVSANANLDILNDDDGQYAVERQCQANCEQGIFYSFEACAGAIGEHSPIEMLLEVGAGLKKLNLGKIGINKIGFNLSDKIELGKTNPIKNFNIPLPSLNIRIPDLNIKDGPQKWQDLSLDSIIFHPPSPEIPTFPWASFSCPTIDAKPYQCLGEGKTDDSYINLEWYLQTFSWLAEKCQEIPTMKGEFGAPKKDKMEQCLDKENVHLTIIRECDEIWKQYFACLVAKIITPGVANCPLPTGVCWDIKRPTERGEAITEQCSSLFREIKEPTPSPCNLGVLKNKCTELREQKREKVPESCKFLPLFTKIIEEPYPQYFQGSSTACSPQTISNTSLTGVRIDCPISAPALSASTPKIKLPDIIIPDIRLPSFNFSPFLRVKLPNFIFEDIIFPELKFCNIDDCGALLPRLNLEIPYPILRIPDIEIPLFYASIPGIPGLPEFGAPKIPLKIEMGKIKFPPIPIPLPEFDLVKNIILSYSIPQISFPEPEIIVNFKGVKIDAVNILL